MLISEVCSLSKIQSLVKEMVSDWGLLKTKDWILCYIEPGATQVAALNTMMDALRARVASAK